MTTYDPGPGSLAVGSSGAAVPPIRTNDLFGATSVAPLQEHFGDPHIRTFKIPGSPLTVGVEIMWDDLSGGYAYEDHYLHAFNKIQSSTMAQNHINRCILPHLFSTSTVDVIDNASKAMFSLDMFDTFFIAGGSTADKAVAAESGLTVTAVTYSPGSNINGLKDLIAGNTHYLGVLRESGAIDLKSDASFTDVGTDFAASTNPGWGAVTTLVNSATPGTPSNLIYAGTSMLYFSGATALGGAATSTPLTNIPGGGYDIGVDTLEQTPLRAYWYWPIASRTTSILQDYTGVGIGPAPGRVVSTDMEGADPWDIVFPLSRAYHPVIWNHKVITDNGLKHVAYNGGNSFTPLGSALDPIYNGAARQKIMANGVHNGELYTLVVNYASSNGAINYGQIKRYDIRKNIWMPISSQIVPATNLATSDVGNLGWPAGTMLGRYDKLPISTATSNLHMRIGSTTATNGWGGQFIEESSTDSYTMWNGVAGFATSGTVTTSTLHLPYPLTGREFHIDGMVSGGDTDTGFSSIVYAYGCGDGNFTNGLQTTTGLPATQRWQYWNNPDTSSLQDRLQIKITATQNAVKTTGNVLPFKVFLRCVVPEEVYEEIFSQRGGY